MSHKKTIRTEYRDAECLEEAFREAAEAHGFQPLVGETHATMYNEERVPVSMRIRRDRQYDSFYFGDFGLARDGETFHIVVDDLDVNNARVKVFLNDLAQRYGLKSTLKDLLAQGWLVSQEAITDEQGNIRLEMTPTRRVLEVQAAQKQEPAQVAVWR
jgi:hypothetical protein